MDSSTEVDHLVLIWHNIVVEESSCFDWLKLKKSLIIQVQNIFSLIQMMYARSSTKIPHFVMTWQKQDHHKQYLLLIG